MDVCLGVQERYNRNINKYDETTKKDMIKRWCYKKYDELNEAKINVMKGHFKRLVMVDKLFREVARSAKKPSHSMT